VGWLPAGWYLLDCGAKIVGAEPCTETAGCMGWTPAAALQRWRWAAAATTRCSTCAPRRAGSCACWLSSSRPAAP